MTFVSLIERNTYEPLFNYFSNKCNNFYIVYPHDPHEKTSYSHDIPNQLLTGKEDFLNLNGTVITPWEGMDNSIKISGYLNENVIKIFRNFLFQEDIIDYIWHYSFLINEQEIFKVNDFNVGVLYISENELNILKKNKILNEDDIL